ncbi:MAG TPA: universal stress protein [Candidatus Nitrosotenuis sp.]|jgi:nucleotide-binding universal stress UspA family protein|nr:universal stress protein [Candidatus Nitrosotenuis sp.]
MKLILAAVDFSAGSERVLAMARELAELIGGRVHLLHVVEPIGDPLDPDPEVRSFHRELEREARQRLEAMLPALQGQGASYSVVLGHRPQVIAREAEDLRAYMVVMGTHAGREEPWAGTSHQVAWRTSRPVLLVPVSEESLVSPGEDRTGLPQTV